jgi:hypothetical protein
MELPKDIQNIIFQYYNEHHINFCKINRTFQEVCSSSIIKPSSVLKVKFEDEYEADDNYEYFRDIFERSIGLLRRFNPDVTKKQIINRIQPIEDDDE